LIPDDHCAKLRARFSEKASLSFTEILKKQQIENNSLTIKDFNVAQAAVTIET